MSTSSSSFLLSLHFTRPVYNIFFSPRRHILWPLKPCTWQILFATVPQCTLRKITKKEEHRPVFFDAPLTERFWLHTVSYFGCTDDASMSHFGHYVHVTRQYWLEFRGEKVTLFLVIKVYFYTWQARGIAYLSGTNLIYYYMFSHVSKALVSLLVQRATLAACHCSVAVRYSPWCLLNS